MHRLARLSIGSPAQAPLHPPHCIDAPQYALMQINVCRLYQELGETVGRAYAFSATMNSRWNGRIVVPSGRRG